MDVLCIGSAVMDITARPVGQRESWKEKQRISDIQIRTGGDAANQSVRLAELGLHAALVASLGEDPNGELLCGALRARGVDTRYVTREKGWATGTALVLVDDRGERRTFSVAGAHSQIGREDLPWRALEDCGAVSLASLFSMPRLEREGLLEFLKEARVRGIPVFADLASDKLGQGLEGVRPFLPYIDYFLPSLYDAREMTGAGSAEEAAALYRDSKAGTVVIKCGSRGCYFQSERAQGWVPAVPVIPVDTTGAGDCMVALFISRILKGEDLEAACRFACAGASLSTLFFGASGEKLSEAAILKWMDGRL